ncbi:hypothetical protein D3C81_1861030 [compost metagenome]
MLVRTQYDVQAAADQGLHHIGTRRKALFFDCNSGFLIGTIVNADLCNNRSHAAADQTYADLDVFRLIGVAGSTTIIFRWCGRIVVSASAEQSDRQDQ